MEISKPIRNLWLKVGGIGLFLVLLLSGCGQSQSPADKACREFKSANFEATSKAFSELARKNPAYMDQATDAFTLKEYSNSLVKWEKDYKKWEQTKGKKITGDKNDSLITMLDNLPPNEPDSQPAVKAHKNSEIFCA